MDTRWKPSVTVAAVIERNGRFLLVEEEIGGRLKLNNPAGHLEPGESPEQACAREALEETAHEFRPTALLGVYLTRPNATQDITYLRLAFRGELGACDPARRLDAPVVRTLWLTADEVRESAPRHRSPLVLRCIEDYLTGISHPLSVISTDTSVWR